MTDKELEQHIHDCGRHMLEEMVNGNRQAADEWLQAQTLAIKARSSAQIARMEAAVATPGTAPCYFHEKAGEDLPALLRRQAA